MKQSGEKRGATAMKGARLAWAMGATLATALAGACEIQPSGVGALCAATSDCAPTLHCHVESLPPVCLPVKPELRNRPPYLSATLLVGDVANGASGNIVAIDPDGDPVTLSIAGSNGETSKTGLSGILSQVDDRRFNFQPIVSGVPADVVELFEVEATDGIEVVKATLFVYLVDRGASGDFMEWTGDTSDGFAIPDNWEPPTPPSSTTTIYVPETLNAPSGGAGAARNLYVANGATVDLDRLELHGDFALSAGATEAEVVIPASTSQIVLSGVIGGIDLQRPAALIAGLEVEGDVVLAGPVAGLDVGGNTLVVHGQLIQRALGPGVRLGTDGDTRGTLVAHRDVTLEPATRRLGRGDLYVQGSLTVHGDAVTDDDDIAVSLVGGGSSSVFFSSPTLAKIAKVFVGQPGTQSGSTSFTSDAQIGTLDVLGELVVAPGKVLLVDVLTVRGNAVLAEQSDGAIYAASCTDTPRSASLPAWIHCGDAGDIDDLDPPSWEPPGDLVDGGPEDGGIVPDGGPLDAGDPLDGGLIDGGIVDGGGGLDGGLGDGGVVVDGGGGGDDAGVIDYGTCPALSARSRLLTHGLVVALAGSGPVQDKLAFATPATGFVPQSSTTAAGSLTLGADGTFVFTPGALPITSEWMVELVTDSGVEQGCLTVQVFDGGGFNQLQALSADDPSSWSLGSPAPGTVAYVRAGAHTLTTPITVGELYLESGAVLSIAGGGQLSVDGSARSAGKVLGDGAVVIQNGSAAGRLYNVLCNGNIALEAMVDIAGTLGNGGNCGLSVGPGRARVATLSLAGLTALSMTSPDAVLEVSGNFAASQVVPELTAGQIIARGNVGLYLLGGAATGTTLRLESDGGQTVNLPSFGTVLARGNGQLTFESTTSLSSLTSSRPTDALSQLSATILVVESGFSTTTHANICGTCIDADLPGTCATLCQ